MHQHWSNFLMLSASYRDICLNAGVSKQALPQLVEEQIQRNRRVRERQLRKKQGLPPQYRRRRPPSEVSQDPGTSKFRSDRRKAENASRVDDGELGQGFKPRRPPRSLLQWLPDPNAACVTRYAGLTSAWCCLVAM